MRNSSLLVLAALLLAASSQAQTPKVLLAASSQAQTPKVLLAASSQAQTPKVLLVGWDGVRVAELASTPTPNLDSLIQEGTFSDSALTRMPTVSGPGWSSMVTGVWAEKHGVMGNEFSDNDYERYPDFLTRLEQVNPQFNTFAVLNWPPLGTTASGGPMIGDGIDMKIDIDGDQLGYGEADRLACQFGADELKTGSSDALFVYLGNIDVVGHDTSSLSPEYREAIQEADHCLGQLVAALKARETFADENWLILMSTDHGRTDQGGHGGDSLKERTIFYLASGPSAGRGAPAHTAHIVDVAVTALTHLGVTIDPDWGLDGKVTGLKTSDN
jgi:predicted AlkP superfamily pyrophosphatase or phosphodiesterase